MDRRPDVVAPAGVVLTDEDIVDRVRAGDVASFEVLMRRHNQRVYRVARAIVRNDGDAEDVMQQAYVNAFRHLDQFEHRAKFTTWLTRIVVHEALRRRRGQRIDTVDYESESQRVERAPASTPDPERAAYHGELKAMLERAIESLPDPYRLVFVLRDVEGLSTAETAASLEIGEEAVKTRLHRGRAMLRRTVMAQAGATASQVFSFHLSRCDVIVARVLAEVTRA